jgi:hypothetical protein
MPPRSCSPPRRCPPGSTCRSSCVRAGSPCRLTCCTAGSPSRSWSGSSCSCSVRRRRTEYSQSTRTGSRSHTVGVDGSWSHRFHRSGEGSGNPARKPSMCSGRARTCSSCRLPACISCFPFRRACTACWRCKTVLVPPLPLPMSAPVRRRRHQRPQPRASVASRGRSAPPRSLPGTYARPRATTSSGQAS